MWHILTFLNAGGGYSNIYYIIFMVLYVKDNFQREMQHNLKG